MEKRIKDLEPNKYLIEIQKTVIDWLKFAEAKNATLLAGNLAIIFGASKIALFSEAQMFTWVWFYFISIAGFCGLSAVCCLLSIVPQIKIPFSLSGDGKNASSNLVFYGTIASHTPETYADALQKCLNVTFNPVEKLLAGQIVINSQVANRKYRFFKVAAWLTLSAFLTPVLGGFLVLTCRE